MKPFFFMVAVIRAPVIAGILALAGGFSPEAVGQLEIPAPRGRDFPSTFVTDLPRNVGDAKNLEAIRVLSFPFQNIDHYPVISALDFSNDGKEIYSAGDDCRLYVWDVSTDKPVSRVAAHDDWIKDLALAPNGSEAVSIDQNGTIRGWAVPQFDRKFSLDKKVPGGSGICYSPNNKIVAVVGFQPQVLLLDSQTGREITSLAGPGSNLKAIIFSPQGDMLAVAGRSGIVRIWETQNSRVRFNLATEGKRIHAIAFSPGGTAVAAAGEGNLLYIWETQTGQPIAEIPLEKGKVFSLVFCGENLVATGDSFNLIRIWSIADAKEIARGTGHTGTIATLRYDESRKQLISGSFDTTIRFWNLSDLQ